ncbi:MAG: hypothetical protein ACRD26_13685 [Vicinamibacterales bacterium]
MRNSLESRESCAALARDLAAATTRREARAAIDRRRTALCGSEEPERRRTSPPALVGIWRRTSLDGRTWFVRDDSIEGAMWWAAIDRIGPKRCTRIVFAGESCARGYPLDPLFNCASALTAYLTAAAGAEAVEVVDLARLAMRPPALLEVLEAAAALEPDLYVVFAGNNWTVGLERVEGGDLAAAAGKGWRAVHACCEQRVRAQIREWTARLTGIVAESGMPALFVIPAENIQDYPLAAGLHNPLVASDRQIVRDHLLARIDALGREGRLSESEPLAAELVALEDGCSVAGLQALGRCALARGARDQAAHLFQEARELLVSFAASGAMSSYVARTEELRAGLAAAGVPAVDLPRHFAALSGGALPGREWFYDDCHMTAKGIVAAMAEVTRAALPLLGLPPWREALEETPIAIDPRAEAQAASAAALLNSHDGHLVRGYVARSLAHSQEIAAVWRQYLDVRLRRVGLLFCPAFHALRELERRFPVMRYLDRAMTDGLRPMYERDALVGRAVAQAIAHEYPEAPSRCELLLRRKYAARRNIVDVLEADVGEGTFLGRFPIHRPRAYVRCLRRRVRFHLTGQAPVRGWRFRLTTRVHGRGAMGKTAALLVNDETVATWTVSGAWTTVEGVYDSQGTKRDVDVLTIVWPDPAEDPDDRLRHVARAFEDSLSWDVLANLYTAWGDIQAFSARALVAEPETTPPAMAVG